MHQQNTIQTKQKTKYKYLKKKKKKNQNVLKQFGCHIVILLLMVCFMVLNYLHIHFIIRTHFLAVFHSYHYCFCYYHFEFEFHFDFVFNF